MVSKYLKHGLALDQVKGAHDAHLHGVDQKVIKILGQINPERLAIATNTNYWQTRKVEEELVNLTQYVNPRRVFRSHEMGKIKTDDGFFEAVVESLGVPRHEIYLIDDNLDNCIKARQSGLNAIQFFNASDLERNLRRWRLY